MVEKEINILGAGLCGSLLSIMMAKQGYSVTVREKRSDPRKNHGSAGRSINLAMSAKGINALKYAGIFEQIETLLMPMKGRMLHFQDGREELQPYGQYDHEFIYSVSRSRLNHLLIDAAEEIGVDIKFQHSIESFDKEKNVSFESNEGGYTLTAKNLLVTDGAGSMMRRSFNGSSPILPQEDILPHSYKELTIPADENGSFKLTEKALHVWPRGEFMLIALPNPNGDFTLTLFMPTKGENSFDGLKNNHQIQKFFEKYFSDILILIPNLIEQFQENPTGILGTVKCKHWHLNDHFLLVGDAAHAMVPFHAQGMNSAFDDCVVLDSIVKKYDNWGEIFKEFEIKQKKNANAIQAMALDNYIEMRDGVLDPKFALKKELSFRLEKEFPTYFIPRYSMVMFHNEIPYSMSYERGEIQKSILTELTVNADNIDSIDFKSAEKVIKKELTPL